MGKVNADMARIATWTFQMLPKIEAPLEGEDVRDGNVGGQCSTRFEMGR
jgi:hypothetical protein